VVSEYPGKEGVGPRFFARSIGTVQNHVLYHPIFTGKSEVSASCPRTSVIS
jgi:hypothetical protein